MYSLDSRRRDRTACGARRRRFLDWRKRKWPAQCCRLCPELWASISRSGAGARRCFNICKICRGMGIVKPRGWLGGNMMHHEFPDAPERSVAGGSDRATKDNTIRVFVAEDHQLTQ